MAVHIFLQPWESPFQIAGPIEINEECSSYCIVLHIPNLNALREVKHVSLVCVHGELQTVTVKQND